MRLASADDPMDIFFFDNTDPDGFDRVLEKIGRRSRDHARGRDLQIRRHERDAQRNARGGGRLSRSGPELSETRRRRHRRRERARQGARRKRGWLARFPMHDWVGGRTSVMSAVGLVPAALRGFRHRWFPRRRRRDGRAHASA